MNILVSACLLGRNCKYNGGSNKNEKVIALSKKFNLIPVCPEFSGGLSIPRPPSEITCGKVYSKNGDDITEYFIKGAETVLKKAHACNCRFALLKARSPSCGNNEIYDGSFSNKTISGEGITAALLKRNNIMVFNENQINELIDAAKKYI